MRFFLVLIFSFLPLMALSQNQNNSSLEDKIRIMILSDETSQIQELITTKRETKAIIGKMLPELIVMIKPSTLELLNENGIRFDSKDDDGYSAVMRALQFGRTDNAKKLQELGASLEGVTNDGYTVRLLAENVGLDDFGPAHPSSLNLTMSEEEANQILLYAAEAGDLETVKFALDNGASVHAKANNGWTAAMLAGLGGHAVVLNSLILSDALESNGIYHAADDVDLITAILVGEGGNAQKFWDNVEEMLRFVINHEDVQKTGLLSKRGAKYGAIAERLNYPSKTIDLFSESYKSSAESESGIPFEMLATNKNWKQVQDFLKTNDLLQDSSSKLQKATNVHDAYRPMASLLQNTLRFQGCSVSSFGKLSSGTADGQFGAGSAQGLEKYNLAIASLPRCKRLRELNQIGSKEREVEGATLTEIWLPDALHNITTIVQCMEYIASPICSCQSDPAFEEKDGRCVMKKCSSGEKLNKSSGECVKPLSPLNCTDSSRIFRVYVGSKRPKAKWSGSCNQDGYATGKGRLLFSYQNANTLSLPLSFKGTMIDGYYLKGKLVSGGGSWYEGDFVKSHKQGQGKAYDSSGSIRYVGSYHGHNRNGKGTIFFDKGATWSGNFVNHKPHGRGVYTGSGGIQEKYFYLRDSSGEGYFFE